MADEVPIYRSQAPAPNIGSISIAPVQVPDLHSGDWAAGLKELGQAAIEFGAYKKNADDETRTSVATTEYLQEIDKAETEAANNQDWEKAPVDFRARANEIVERAIKSAHLDPRDEAAYRLKLTGPTLASAGRVDAAALGKQVNVAAAARGSQALALSRAAAMASSPAERKTYIDTHLDSIKRSVAAGLLDADKGEAEAQAFVKSVDDQEIRQLIRTNPGEATRRLNDPNYYKGISGSERETYLRGDEDAKDDAVKDGLVEQASGSTPWIVSMQTNKILSPSHAHEIFRKSVIQVEHGGRPLGYGGANAYGRRHAPAGEKPIPQGDPRLVGIRAASGVTLWVNKEVEAQIAGFVKDYEAAGGVIGPNSGGVGGRGNGSFHPRGFAIDINQTGWGQRGGGVSLDPATENRLAAKWGLRSGDHFGRDAQGRVRKGSKGPDTGHFDAGGGAGGESGGGGGGTPIDLVKAGKAISPAGAIGIAQIMPDTAREMARTAGMPEVADLDDDDLEGYLIAHPEVGEKLGEMYWNLAVKELDGNTALAMAAYNAGIGAAKGYRDRIFAEIGPDASPLQISEWIREHGGKAGKGNKETADYILKNFGLMNVAPTGAGVSPRARGQTITAVQTVIKTQDAEKEKVIRELAASSRTNLGDEVTKALAGGFAAWTPAVDAAYRANVQAAANGSTEAAAFVMKVDTGFKAKPHTDDAWRMAVGDLDSAVSALDARAQSGMATSDELIQLSSYKAVRKDIGDNYKTDPIGLGARAGFYPTQALDMRGATNDPRFQSDLAVRGREALIAEQHYGTLAPLRPDEVTAEKSRFEQMDAPAKAARLRAYSEALDPRVYNALIDQLGLDAATASAGRFALKAPELTTKIVDGASILATPGYEKGAEALQTAAADLIPSGLYPPGTKQLADVMQAVPAVYAANRRRDATMFAKPDSEEMKKSVVEVVGEIVDDIGGRAVAAPPGIGATQMETLWDELDAGQLADAGGAVDGTGREITPADLTDHAVLTQLEPRGTEYFVSMATSHGDVPYFTKDKKPLVIDFGKLASDYGKREIKRPPAAYPIVPPAPGGGDIGANVPGLELPPAAAPVEGAPEFGVPAPDLSGEQPPPGVPTPVNIPGLQ